MHLSSNSYEIKYRKYKNKYQILKSHIGGTKGTLLPSINGGDCDPLPNPEKEDLITTQNLLDLCPEERITIQNKCYEVIGLYKWIVTDNHNILPDTQTVITIEEKQRLIQAYEELQTPNILTRDKLIQIYPNLQQEIIINLNSKGYTDIALGTFNNLPNLQYLYLDYNKIKKLQLGIFDNLPNLRILSLHDNQIQELQLGIFNNLRRLHNLYLSNNLIQELLPGIFNNLKILYKLYLYNNPIQRLESNSYYGLSSGVRIGIY
jgi:hypothetical protein